MDKFEKIPNRDKFDEWGQIPGKFNRDMSFEYTFKNTTVRAACLS